MDEDNNNIKIVLMTEKEDKIELSTDPGHLDVPKRGSFQVNDKNDFGSMRNERSASLDPTQIFDGFDPTQRRVSSISSIGNWTGAVIVSEANQIQRTNGNW